MKIQLKALIDRVQVSGCAVDPPTVQALLRAISAYALCVAELADEIYNAVDKQYPDKMVPAAMGQRLRVINNRVESTLYVEVHDGF